MTAAAETLALKRAVRPHVDLSGERPGNTAEGLLRWAHRVSRNNRRVIVETGIRDGETDDMSFFCIVPRAAMRELFAAAGIDYRDIPNHRDRADLTLITKESK